MRYFLLSAVLLSLFGHRAAAQTPLGKPSLDESKTIIWCATVKFVYDDNRRPNLKSKLNCGGTLKQFESSIRADSQKVYSLLYQPLEGRGAMYKGLSTDDARRQKLVTEIINRLRASPTRKASPARMQAVTALATALNGYLASGTPPGDVGAGLNAETATATSDTDEATAAAPDDAGPNPNYDPPAPTGGGTESLMTRLFAPLAFILSLLSIVLYLLMRRNLNVLSERIGRGAKADAGVNVSTAPGGTFSSKRLTPEQRAEIEKLVQERVAEALARPPQEDFLPDSVAEVLSAVSPAAEVAPAPATPAPAEPAPATTPAEPAAAPAMPAFEPEAAPTPPPPAVDQVLYAQRPVQGVFYHADLLAEPLADSVYELVLSAQYPEASTFGVNPDPLAHAHAMQSVQYALHEACQYEQPDEPVSYIINDEPGTLRRTADGWQIVQRATVHFE